jgi:ubiquinone/menaquinone biosynthesis C-methylase UbiE
MRSSLMNDFTAEEVVRRYDLSAEQYAALYSEYGDINRQVLLTPAILEMLGGVAGKNILDAGCGEGYLSRLVAGRGASVTAVDYAEKLLEIARERTADDLGVDYLHANLEDLDMLDDDTFDIVVSCIVIQAVPNYQAAIGEMHRVLRSGGTCILAITHPCFSSDGGWIKDAKGKKLYWKIDNYFYERGFETSWPQDSDNRLINFHRTLTSYFGAIIGTGFVIQDLVEPYPSQEAIKQHPSFADDLRMSHFLVFELMK